MMALRPYAMFGRNKGLHIEGMVIEKGNAEFEIRWKRAMAKVARDGN